MASNKSIKMIAGLSKPPFVIADRDKGMQIEIIKAAFKRFEQGVHFIYLPISRHLDVFKQREIDGIITLGENEKHLGYCLTKPYIVYQNVVVTLEKSALTVEYIDDLTPLKVAAFQNAVRFLGKNYRRALANSNRYVELPDQNSQLGLLFSGRVDAIIIDVNIFKYLLNTKRYESVDNDIYHQKFKTHFLFHPTKYSAGFKSKQLCEKFNEGIDKIKANGSYQRIIDNYLQQ